MTTTPLSEERDLTNIDRLRIGALHVEPPFTDEDLLDEITALESELERLRDMLDRVAASDQAARASDRKRGELLVEAACRITELEEQNARWQVMVDRMAERAADNLLRAREAERRVTRLEGVLREVEWVTAPPDLSTPPEHFETSWRFCPECKRYIFDGPTVQPEHRPNCALDAALRGGW